MCREIYHGTRWNTDTRFSAPMVSVSHDIPVFLRDCVTFLHPQVGLATGIIVQFFLKVCVNVLWGNFLHQNNFLFNTICIYVVDTLPLLLIAGLEC